MVLKKYGVIGIFSHPVFYILYTVTLAKKVRNGALTVPKAKGRHPPFNIHKFFTEFPTFPLYKREETV